MYMKEAINSLSMESLKNGSIMFEMNSNTAVVMGYDPSIHSTPNSMLPWQPAIKPWPLKRALCHTLAKKKHKSIKIIFFFLKMMILMVTWVFLRCCRCFLWDMAITQSVSYCAKPEAKKTHLQSEISKLTQYWPLPAA